MGKSQERVRQALEAIARTLPFPLRGIDSDNGSEFINDHLYRYCRGRGIQFTRGRPYKKDDNAHIEQKNWTHVRKLVGYVRYDSPAALEGLNALYADVRLFQNLWLPSVKLVKKTRVGSRLQRQYGPPQTPFERVRACPAADPAKVAELARIHATLDPFALAARIDQQLQRLYGLATHRRGGRPVDAAGPVEHAKNGRQSVSPPLGAGLPAP
jgi:transposase InsO family protein